MKQSIFSIKVIVELSIFAKLLIENHGKVNGFDSNDPQHFNKKQGERRPTKAELEKKH